MRFASTAGPAATKEGHGPRPVCSELPPSVRGVFRPCLRQWMARIAVFAVLFFFLGFVSAQADCEAPVTFMGFGWYYCEEEYDYGERHYYAAPAELLLLSEGKMWGVTIGCDFPPKWKFWADPEFNIIFLVPKTDLKIGDISLTVLSKTYDARARILDPNDDRPYPLHRTAIDDPDSVDSIIRSLNNTDTLRWKYPDSSHVNEIGTMTLAGVLPYVFQACGAILDEAG